MKNAKEIHTILAASKAAMSKLTDAKQGFGEIQNQYFVKVAESNTAMQDATPYLGAIASLLEAMTAYINASSEVFSALAEIAGDGMKSGRGRFRGR